MEASIVVSFAAAEGGTIFGVCAVCKHDPKERFPPNTAAGASRAYGREVTDSGSSRLASKPFFRANARTAVWNRPGASRCA